MTLQRDLPKSPRNRAWVPNRAVSALLLAIVGLVVTFIAFFYGIDAALAGSGAGPGFFVALLIVGLITSTTALVLALIGVIGGTRRLLSVAALLIALIPGAGILAILIAARS